MKNYEELWNKKKAELAAKVVNAPNAQAASRYAMDLAEMEMLEHGVEKKGCCCQEKVGKNEADGDTKGNCEPKDSTEAMFMDLARYAAPFVKFIHDRFNPHTMVIISDGLVRVMTDEIGVPLKEEE